MATMRCFILLFLILPGILSSQTDSLKQKRIDSLTLKFKADSAHLYRFQKFRPYLSLDNRNSFISGQPVNFKGIQFGIIYREKHTFALGFYGMSQNSKKPIATRDGTISARKTTSLNYMTFFYEYAFIEREHFELDIPLEIGLGGYDIKLQDSTGRIYNDRRGGIIPIGIGIQPVYKPWKWIGLSLLLGYRAVLDGNAPNFNGVYFAFGINLDIRQIYRDIRFYGFTKKRYKRQVRKISGSSPDNF